MADGQISFFHLNSADASSFSKEGAIIVSKRDEENRYADMYIDVDNKRWTIKPSYSWDDEVQEQVESVIDELLKRKAQELLLKYLRIKRTNNDDGITLDIWTMSGDDVVTRDGELLTTSELVELITEGTENGTIAVDDNLVKVHGLDTAAYTPTEAYTPMDVSEWVSLGSDVNG